MVTRRRFLETSVLAAAGLSAAEAAPKSTSRPRGPEIRIALDVLGAPEGLADGAELGLADALAAARGHGARVVEVAAGLEATASVVRTGLRVGSRTDTWRVLPPAASLAGPLVRWLAATGVASRLHLAAATTAEGRAVKEAAQAAASALGLRVAERPEDGDLLWLSDPPAAPNPFAPPPAPDARPAATPWVPLDPAGRPGLLHTALWHPSLAAPGARALSVRFSSRFGRPMDSYAWMGWISVKAAAEAALRAGSAEPMRVRAALAGIELDGRKGRPLRFLDLILVQPVYVVGPSPSSSGEAVLRGELAVPTAP